MSNQWFRLVVLGLLALAVVTAFGFWWFGIRSSPTPSEVSTATTPAAVDAPAGEGAITVSERGLHTLASLGRSIYWVGSRPGTTYELTQRPDGRVYLRYLGPSTPIGSPELSLTVATYPVTNAYAVTRDIAQQAGSVEVPVKDGVAFYRSQLPTNIYVAYRDSDYQVEVFDPSAAKALELVTSGAITEVQGAATGATVPKSAAVGVRPDQLSKLAARLGRPLFWAGKQPGARYELTQTPDGRVYVRYLSAGAAVGSAEPFLTVGTYPLANAYETTKAAAGRPASVPIEVPGAVAFYSKNRPTSVYMAFPGVNAQVEVFDPDATRLHSLVAQHAIGAVH